MLFPVPRKRTREPVKAHNVVFYALVAVLLFLTWPQSLGGSVAYVKVNGHSMDGTYKTGDLVIVHTASHYDAGDIIAYRIPKDEFGSGAQVIHRIIGGTGHSGYITKGDNRTTKDDWYPKNSDVVGRAWVRIPGAGTWFSNLSKPIPLGVICAGMTIFVMVLPRRAPNKGKDSPTKRPRVRRIPPVSVDLSTVAAAASSPQPVARLRSTAGRHVRPAHPSRRPRTTR